MWQKAKSLLKTSKLIRHIILWRYEKLFSSRGGYALNKGVFDSFLEAEKSAPKRTKVGFDHSEMAKQFTGRIKKIDCYDYPVLYWFYPIINSCKKIVDIGGHIGVNYYSYKPYLKYPSELEWKVIEVPSVAEAGKKIAESNDAHGLLFSSDFKDADYSDVLYAAGSIQYIESPRIVDMLRYMKSKPKHIVINKVPIYDGEEFVSLQNAGVSFAPRYVFNQKKFIAGIENMGYKVIDRWSVPERNFSLPLDPIRSFGNLSGLYFQQI